MSIESLNECIENGDCKAILHKMSHCSYCSEMKEKLDEIGVEYEEQEEDSLSLEEFNRKTVPFLEIKRGYEDDIILENEEKSILREKLSRVRL